MISKSLIKKYLKQVTLTNIDIVTEKILNKMGGGETMNKMMEKTLSKMVDKTLN